MVAFSPSRFRWPSEISRQPRVGIRGAQEGPDGPGECPKGPQEHPSRILREVARSRMRKSRGQRWLNICVRPPTLANREDATRRNTHILPVKCCTLLARHWQRLGIELGNYACRHYIALYRNCCMTQSCTQNNPSTAACVRSAHSSDTPAGLRPLAVRRGRVAAAIGLRLQAKLLRGAVIRHARALVVTPVEAAPPLCCVDRSAQAGRGSTRGPEDQHAHEHH